MFKGVSKEIKVGSLAAIAITVLILGYNYMVGRDNPLGTAREFYVVYDSTQGLADNTAVMFNGFRIGQLRKLEMNDETGKPIAMLEVYNKLKIPKDSRVKIESSLLGTTTLKLILGKSKELAEDGDTLRPDYTQDVMSMVNEKIAPIATGADSLLAHLNALIARASVQRAFDDLPIVLESLNKTIMEIQGTVAEARPGLSSTLDNVGRFSGNLQEYNKTITASLKSFEKLAGQVDSIQLTRIAASLEQTISSLSALTNGIASGEGTLGKLAQDKTLYNNLVKTTGSLECLLNDIKGYPEKYLPLPWGKRQRRKAKEASSATNQCFAPDSAVSR